MENKNMIFSLDDQWPVKDLEFNNILIAVLPNDNYESHVMAIHKQMEERVDDGDDDKELLPVFFTHHNPRNHFLRQIGAVSGSMGKMTHPAYFHVRLREHRFLASVEKVSTPLQSNSPSEGPPPSS